jgi:hypothetical protein
MEKGMKITLIALIVIGGLVFTAIQRNDAQHKGYIQGCADIMTGLYDRMGITVDVKSLNSFCEEKWGNRK